MRSFDVAEPRALDLDVAVAFLRCIPDLASYMLALPVAISPDNESLGISCLRLDVLRDGLLVLRCLLEEVTPRGEGD